MLQPGDRLDLLIGELAAMRARDRKAILAHLPDDQRTRLEGLLRGDTANAGSSRSDAVSFCHDISARIAAVRRGEDAGMTAAGRAALLRAVAADAPLPGRNAASLVDGLGAALRGRSRP